MRKCENALLDVPSGSLVCMLATNNAKERNPSPAMPFVFDGSRLLCCLLDCLSDSAAVALWAL